MSILLSSSTAQTLLVLLTIAFFCAFTAGCHLAFARRGMYLADRCVGVIMILAAMIGFACIAIVCLP